MSVFMLTACKKDNTVAEKPLEQQKVEFQQRQLEIEQQKLAIEKERMAYEAQKKQTVLLMLKNPKPLIKEIPILSLEKQCIKIVRFT